MIKIDERMKKWRMIWPVCMLVASSVEAQILPPVRHDSTYVYTRQGEFHYKSPQEAFWLSFGNTVVPVLAGTIILDRTNINDSKTLRIGAGAMIAYGLIVGPSIGLYYAGSDEKASGGILGRIGASALGVAGAYWGLVVGFANAYGDNGNGQKYEIIPSIVFYTGVILLTGSATLQIIKAPAEARKHNNKVHLSIAPTWYPREKAPGLAINIHF